MQLEISRLEKAWLKAETLADEAKSRAANARRAVEKVKKQGGGDELKVLLSTAETARAEHEAAEQMANDAFERLWQAKGQGGSRGQLQEQMNA